MHSKCGAVGMQSFGDDWLCVLITPWFMNLVLLPNAGKEVPARVGTASSVLLPGGTISFIQSDAEGLGPHRMCSLFSPVFEFPDLETAILTARAVLDELMTPTSSAPDPDGMVAVWEGRIEDAELKAEANRLEELAAVEAAKPQAQLSRRALFGLTGQGQMPEGRS